jgi:hypothetical protein
MENRSGGGRQDGATFLTVSAARAVALRNLGFVASASGAGVGARSYADISSLSFRAECLRSALWSSSNAGNMPVYVTRLLGVTEPLIMADPEFAKSRISRADEGVESRDVLRESLEEMELIGDLARLPGGYWLPSPLRVVPLHAVNRWLLISGRPTWALPKDLVKNLEYTGVARFSKESIAALPTQSEENWCRLPKGNVDKWAASTIERADLQQFDDPEIEFEFYAAGVPGVYGASDGFQLRRWTRGGASLPDGRYLVRQRLFRGRTHHAIAEVRNGRTVATGSMDTEVDVRRLMYGIDLLRGCPVSVRVARQSDSSRFVLSNEVPRAEHRLLTALGTLQIPADGKYYPRVWTCAERYGAQIERTLTRLGVRVVEDRKDSR